jgi:carboxyl-terminal processing protease
MSVGQAKNLLAGQLGSGVKVGVIRRGKTDPEELEVVREKLSTPRLIAQRVDNETLALRFPTLDAGRADEIRTRLLDAQKQGVNRVILDLRECGRGPVSEAIAIARLFVPSGQLVALRGQTVPTQVFSADASKVVWKGPVSVLMDGTTTGAAEVLAASLANTKRGDLVGDRTFGLASEQKLIPLDDGAALFLTVANYYNADGKSILDEGVTPTEVVRASAAAADDSDDGEEDVTTTPGTPKDSTIGPRPLSSDDPVLRRALELLKSPVKKAA